MGGRARAGASAGPASAGIHPLRCGRPDDAAAAVAFLPSDAARWITGVTLPLDGGFTAG